jgi:excisionase family DNA binding protein
VADDTISVREAADLCAMAYATMLAMVRRGELRAEKPDGKSYGLRRSDVDGFIERSRVEPGQLASAPPRIPPAD